MVLSLDGSPFGPGAGGLRFAQRLHRAGSLWPRLWALNSSAFALSAVSSSILLVTSGTVPPFSSLGHASFIASLSLTWSSPTFTPFPSLITPLTGPFGLFLICSTRPAPRPYDAHLDGLVGKSPSITLMWVALQQPASPWRSFCLLS